MKIYLTLALVVITLTSAGCHKTKPDLVGDYQGYIFKRKSGAAAKQIPVHAKLTSSSKKQFQLEVFDSWKNQLQNQFTLELDSEKKVNISSAIVSDETISLKSEVEGCFEKITNQFGLVRLCNISKAISIEVEKNVNGEQFELTLDRLKPIAIPSPEIPKEYSIEEIINHTLQRNFESRIQFEHSTQARLQAQTAYLNLLPHFSTGSILSISSGGALGLLGAIGDLAPFLFPSRWLQAKSATEISSAEEDALILMRADSANIAEGLIYVTLRDLRARELINEMVSTIEPARDEIRFREKLGQFIPGTSDDLTAVINSMLQDLTALELTLKYEYRGIAQTMGLTNPDAVSGISNTPHHDISKPIEVEAHWLLEETLNRSIELRQMDSLIEAARLNKTERYFTWLDPAGDYRGGLGINLLSYVPIGTSQIRELYLKRELLQNVLQQKILNIVADIENSKEPYRLALLGKDLNQRRINRYLQQIRLGTGFDITGLTVALQDYLKSGIAEITSEATYNIAVSKMNRMLLADYYRGIAVRPISPANNAQNPEIR